MTSTDINHCRREAKELALAADDLKTTVETLADALEEAQAENATLATENTTLKNKVAELESVMQQMDLATS